MTKDQIEAYKSGQDDSNNYIARKGRPNDRHLWAAKGLAYEYDVGYGNAASYDYDRNVAFTKQLVEAGLREVEGS